MMGDAKSITHFSLTRCVIMADSVGFGDKTVELSNFERYKGVKGRTDRIAILSPKLKRAYRFHVQAKQRSFQAPTNPETLEKVKALLGEPEQVFGMVLFHYSTGEDGLLLDPEKLAGKVKLYRISESRYSSLSAIANEWPLMDTGEAEAQVDLLFKCTDDKFQRMEISVTREAHFKKKDVWYKALQGKLRLAESKIDFVLGEKLTDTQIFELLGVASVQQQQAGASTAASIDVGGIID